MSPSISRSPVVLARVSDPATLQQYLVAELKRLAERPTIDEVLDRVERRGGGWVGLAQAAADLTEDRQSQ